MQNFTQEVAKLLALAWQRAITDSYLNRGAKELKSGEVFLAQIIERVIRDTIHQGLPLELIALWNRKQIGALPHYEGQAEARIRSALRDIFLALDNMPAQNQQGYRNIANNFIEQLTDNFYQAQEKIISNLAKSFINFPRLKSIAVLKTDQKLDIAYKALKNRLDEIDEKAPLGRSGLPAKGVLATLLAMLLLAVYTASQHIIPALLERLEQPQKLELTSEDLWLAGKTLLCSLVTMGLTLFLGLFAVSCKDEYAEIKQNLIEQAAEKFTQEIKRLQSLVVREYQNLWSQEETVKYRPTKSDWAAKIGKIPLFTSELVQNIIAEKLAEMPEEDRALLRRVRLNPKGQHPQDSSLASRDFEI